MEQSLQNIEASFQDMVVKLQKHKRDMLTQKESLQNELQGQLDGLLPGDIFINLSELNIGSQGLQQDIINMVGYLIYQIMQNLLKHNSAVIITLYYLGIKFIGHSEDITGEGSPNGIQSILATIINFYRKFTDPQVNLSMNYITCFSFIHRLIQFIMTNHTNIPLQLYDTFELIQRFLKGCELLLMALIVITNNKEPNQALTGINKFVNSINGQTHSEFGNPYSKGQTPQYSSIFQTKLVVADLTTKGKLQTITDFMIRGLDDTKLLEDGVHKSEPDSSEGISLGDAVSGSPWDNNLLASIILSNPDIFLFITNGQWFDILSDGYDQNKETCLTVISNLDFKGSEQGGGSNIIPPIKGKIGTLAQGGGDIHSGYKKKIKSLKKKQIRKSHLPNVYSGRNKKKTNKKRINK